MVLMRTPLVIRHMALLQFILLLLGFSTRSAEVGEEEAGLGLRPTNRQLYCSSCRSADKIDALYAGNCVNGAGAWRA